MALVIIINNAIVKLGGVNIVCSLGKRVTVLFFAATHKSDGLVKIAVRAVCRASAMLAPVPRTFLIDTDTASDDAVALIMALRAPDVRVAAITVVAGNVEVQQATRNALYTVELCGANVPVYSGAEKPLLRTYEKAT